MRDFRITESVLEGEYTDPQDREDLLAQAGNILDKHESGEMVGDNLFLTDDGRLISTSVEVVIFDVSDTADENYSDQLHEAMIIKCPKCGLWHHEYKECPSIEHKSLDPLIVHIEGGVLQNVYTDADVEVVLLDSDTEGGEDDERCVEINNGRGGMESVYAVDFGAEALGSLPEGCDMKQILAKMYERDGVQ